MFCKKNKNSHSEVEPSQPVERGQVCDEEPGLVRCDVLDQLAGGLVPDLQVVDLAPAHLPGAEDQQAVAGLVVEGAGQVGGGLTGLDHLVAARQYLDYSLYIQVQKNLMNQGFTYPCLKVLMR